MVDVFLDLLDVIGSLAFAFSGALAAKKKNMDGFGIIFLASITTFGGGLTRDVLLNSKPIAIFETPRYFIIAIIAGIIVRYIDHRKIEKQSLFIALFDASGLAVFTALGTTRAIQFEAPFHGSLIMGVVTGCVGGIIRDLLCNQSPMIFYGDFYARAALLGSFILYSLLLLKMPEVVAIVSCVLIVFTIRIYMIIKNPQYQEQVKQRLPKFTGKKHKKH